MRYNELAQVVKTIEKEEAEITRLEAELKERKIRLTLKKVKAAGTATVSVVYNEQKILAIKFVKNYGGMEVAAAKDHVLAQKPFSVNVDLIDAEHIIWQYEGVVKFEF
jgi:hypothetical protein